MSYSSLKKTEIDIFLESYFSYLKDMHKKKEIPLVGLILSDGEIVYGYPRGYSYSKKNTLSFDLFGYIAAIPIKSISSLYTIDCSGVTIVHKKEKMWAMLAINMESEFSSYLLREKYGIIPEIMFDRGIEKKPRRRDSLGIYLQSRNLLYSDFQWLRVKCGGINNIGVGIFVVSFQIGKDRSLISESWKLIQKAKHMRCENLRYGKNNEMKILGTLHISSREIEIEGEKWVCGKLSCINENKKIRIYLKKNAFLFPLVQFKHIKSTLNVFGEYVSYHDKVSKELTEYVKARIITHM